MTIRFLVAAMVAMTLSAASSGQTRVVEVGADAPRISATDWVAGEKIEQVEAERSYLIFFGRIVSDAFRRLIPNLSELQENYPDAVIAVITDEPVDVVRPFVQQQGDKVKFRIAVDTQRQTQRDWIQNREQDVPWMFLVGTDKKIWLVANPAGSVATRTYWRRSEAILAGRFEPTAWEKAEPMFKQVDYSRDKEDWRQCYRYIDEIVNIKPRVFVNEAIDKFEIMTKEQKKPQDAIDYARGQFMDWYGADDPQTLTQLAQTIMNDAEIFETDRAQMSALALELCERAFELSPAEPRAMAALADAHFRNGDVEKAVEFARRAYYAAKPDRKSEYKHMLDLYTRRAQMQRDRGGR
jgi:hypothetical protein